jgi:murein L,D-transpeptidase YcbB/YkuD
VKPTLRMNVVVGKALNTRTPVFFETMRYVVFRPYWNVPYSIARNELAPALRRDSQALVKRDMELVQSFDDTNALPITPENIERLASGRLKARQRPGPKNSLGLAKFIFPNSNDVYMHGTPSQSAFGRSRRDLSHGCVRLEDPAAMAEFVLKDQPSWTPERIRAAMNADKPQRVDLRRPVQVLLFYTTALVDLDGRVLFYEDIYGHDAKLERELEAAYPYQP